VNEGHMQLDVRLPIGLLFCLFGAILSVFGLISGQAPYDEHSFGIDVNLDWGLVLLVFGAAMLALALRAKVRLARAGEPSPPR
jgi:hypothetical protein